jgi:hypothetical protein
MALFGHGAMSELSPLSGVKRKSKFGAATSVIDPEQNKRFTSMLGVWQAGSRYECVVPTRTSVVRRQREFLELFGSYSTAFSIDFLIKASFYLESSGGYRTSDEGKHHV